jgi:hypothetical protein
MDFSPLSARRLARFLLLQEVREAATRPRPHSGGLTTAQRQSAFGQELPTGGDHRFGSLVDRLDDLGVVDPAEVSGRDREVGVLALDHDQRDSLTRHLWALP